jgi:sigma-B regulation protein RsbU (phosphoserine phosphatase)
MPIGALSKIEYVERKLEVKFGDFILMFTDGLPESKNAKGEMYDYEKILTILQDYSEGSSQNIIEKLVADGEKFLEGTEQEDDITIVAIKFI